MIFSYYPGCTLRTKAKDLDDYGRFALSQFDIHLCEVPDWQCCGGAFSTAKDEIASKLSSIRALDAARTMGTDLVALCSACFNVIKQVNAQTRSDSDFAQKANNYLKLEQPYNGETRIIHYLELLRDKIGFEQIAKKVLENPNNPLKGKKIGAYYGCLLLRPSNIMQFDNPENPTIIEDLIKSLGAEPVKYSLRNECCGGYITIEDKSIAAKKSSRILNSAFDFGAEMLITACPLCLYNLVKNGSLNNQSKLPIFYITTLLAAALGNQKACKDLGIYNE